jgi:hypothetical protein
MIANYFSIEREGRCTPPLVIRDEDNNVAFEDLMNMSYDEMKVYKDLELFVDCVMDVANEYFEESDEPTMITLIGKDDVFIWGILIGPAEDADKLKYALINWKKDGKSYGYEKD